MGSRWDEIWASRTVVDSPPGDPIDCALRLNGYDSEISGNPTARDFADLVRAWGAMVPIRPDESVFELGCGAGAFLESAVRVLGLTRAAGCDLSPSLVEAGRRLFPHLDLSVGSGATMPTEPRFDHCASFGVFIYFPDLAYARNVVARLKAKAHRSVSIFDVPDARTRDACESFRRQAYGDARYETDYRGLDHLYLERSWMASQFEPDDWQVTIEDQSLSGYANAPYRFNVVATRT